MDAGESPRLQCCDYLTLEVHSYFVLSLIGASHFSWLWYFLDFVQCFSRSSQGRSWREEAVITQGSTSITLPCPTDGAPRVLLQSAPPDSQGLLGAYTLTATSGFRLRLLLNFTVSAHSPVSVDDLPKAGGSREIYISSTLYSKCSVSGSSLKIFQSFLKLWLLPMVQPCSLLRAPARENSCLYLRCGSLALSFVALTSTVSLNVDL